MNSCERCVEKIKELFQKIPVLRPQKKGKIFMKIEDCLIAITHENKEITVEQVNANERKDELLINFSDFETFFYVMDARDLQDYGDRLVYSVALKGKINLDAVEKNPIRNPFYKLICRSRMKKGIQVFEMVIPLYF
ncbi:MAG: hypothetical protein ACXQS8_02600 [Candidatus Helarchaeales archaeon]